MKSIFDNFKTQLSEWLYSFSNTYSQLTELLNYNQLSELIAIQMPKHSLTQSKEHLGKGTALFGKQ